MASILLGLSLAYLRLERFQHQSKLQKRAIERLQELTKDGKEIPLAYRKSDYYKRLTSLTGQSQDREVRRLLGLSGNIYTSLFDSQWDRKISVVLAWVAFFLVVLGCAHATKQVQFLTFLFDAEQIAWSLWLLASFTAFSVIVVLAGDKYVSRAYDVIDADAGQFAIFLKQRAFSAEIQTETD